MMYDCKTNMKFEISPSGSSPMATSPAPRWLPLGGLSDSSSQISGQKVSTVVSRKVDLYLT